MSRKKYEDRRICESDFQFLSLSLHSVTQQPNSGLGRLIVEVSRSRTIRNTYPAGLLWTSNQPVAEAATYTTHNRRNK